MFLFTLTGNEKTMLNVWFLYVSQKQRLPIHGTVKIYTVALNIRTVLTFTTWAAV